MTTIIKSQDAAAGRVRGLMSRPVAPAPTAEARRIAELEGLLHEAKGVISALQGQVEALTADVESARRDGRAEGLVEGRRSADDGVADRLKVLTAAAATAEQAFRTALGELEATAGDLAGVALGRIVGDVATRADLVADTVRLALGETFRDTAVRVEVAQADFPDAVALQALGLSATAPLVELQAVADLAAGGCRIRLKLGEVDLGLDGQTARLRALLGTGMGAS